MWGKPNAHYSNVVLVCTSFGSNGADIGSFLVCAHMFWSQFKLIFFVARLVEAVRCWIARSIVWCVSTPLAMAPVLRRAAPTNSFEQAPKFRCMTMWWHSKACFLAHSLPLSDSYSGLDSSYSFFGFICSLAGFISSTDSCSVCFTVILSTARCSHSDQIS